MQPRKAFEPDFNIRYSSTPVNGLFRNFSPAPSRAKISRDRHR